MNILFPKDYITSVYQVDFKKLYEEGYRLLLFDLDNTLVMHGEPADLRAKKLFKDLREIGYKFYFLSNNKEARVKKFCEDVKGDGYIFKAKKPSKISYLKACEMTGIGRDKAIFFGDQIFTDILGANRAGILSIMVKPVKKWHEEIQIIIKRFIEAPIILCYKSVNVNKIGIIPMTK